RDWIQTCALPIFLSTLFAVRLILLAYINEKAVTQDLSADQHRELQRAPVAQRECFKYIFVKDAYGRLDNVSPLDLSKGVADVPLIEIIERKGHPGKFRMLLIEQHKSKYAILYRCLLAMQRR